MDTLKQSNRKANQIAELTASVHDLKKVITELRASANKNKKSSDYYQKKNISSKASAIYYKEQNTGLRGKLANEKRTSDIRLAKITELQEQNKILTDRLRQIKGDT